MIPFAFVRSFDVLDPSLAGGPGFSKDTEDDLGLDAKFVLRDSLVLDLTYNPDFSQVESDQPQVTVNERYEVQFPEAGRSSSRTPTTSRPRRRSCSRGASSIRRKD